jgi:hypothetical protein
MRRSAALGLLMLAAIAARDGRYIEGSWMTKHGCCAATGDAKANTAATTETETRRMFFMRT